LEDKEAKRLIVGLSFPHRVARLQLLVARRTVTKCRKAMNIPSSRGRRDWSKGEK
jgi:hypothetical protein